MPILKQRDVTIRPSIAQNTFEIHSSPESYSLVRSVVSVLQASYGLPVAYLSESASNFVGESGNILTIDGRKVHSFCKIQVVAWEMGIKGVNGMRELAEEIAGKLRSVGLEVVVEL